MGIDVASRGKSIVGMEFSLYLCTRDSVDVCWVISFSLCFASVVALLSTWEINRGLTIKQKAFFEMM